jgi:hypothetical protein
MSSEQRKISRLQFGQFPSLKFGVSGFRVTGIHPFDPSAIPELAFSVPQGEVDDEATQLQSETFFPASLSQECPFDFRRACWTRRP